MGITNMPYSVQFTKVKDKRKLQYLTLKGCMAGLVIKHLLNTGKAGLSKLMQHPVLQYTAVGTVYR